MADVTGNLMSGVSVNFNVSGVLGGGTAKFYVYNKWLKMDFSATIFGLASGSIMIRLMPMPN